MHRIRSAAKSNGSWATKGEKVSIWTPWIRHRPEGPHRTSDPEHGTDRGIASGSTDSEDHTADPPNPKSRNPFRRMKKKHDDSAEKNVPVADANGKQHFKLIPQLKVIFGSWINILLIAVPIGFVSNYIHGFPPSAVFVINFLAIVPLAALLSFATEEIALRVGETLGGLLNATFGNAVELIVSVIALTKNEIVIVQTSLVGSILSNLLLVMGMSFFFGGLTRVEQFFNVTVAQTAASLLTLAIGSLIIPAAFNIFNGPSNYGVIEISRGTSIILLSVYGCYLFFQLKTHAMIFNDPSQKAPKRKNLRKNPEGKTIITGDYAKQHTDAAGGVGPIPEESTANTSSSPNDPIESGSTGSAEQDNREPASISLIAAIVTLGIATVLIAFTAEFMVGSIDDITNGGKISKTFVGLILLPIVGNAAEHVTAVTVACKDKMDLAIGVAVGSSMQIALLVIPFVVVLGWILNKPAMSLDFDGFQVAVLFVSILLVNYLIQDGKSHWLEGTLLMALYLIIATCSWYYPEILPPM